MRGADILEIRAPRRDPSPRLVLTRPDRDAMVVDAVPLLARYRPDDDEAGRILLVLNEDSPSEEQLHLVLVRDTTMLDH